MSLFLKLTLLSMATKVIFSMATKIIFTRTYVKEIRSITPEGRSRELIACVQDQKRIGFEIMDILGPKKLESRKNTKTSLKKVYFALGCILAMNLAIIIAMYLQ